MTPRRLDPDVVRNKLDAIDHTCGVLASLGDVDAQRLKPSVGMRNVIVHEYVRLDLDLVATAVPEAIDAYRAYVTAVAGAPARGSG